MVLHHISSHVMTGCAWIGGETRVANVCRSCGEWWFGHFFAQPSCGSAPTIKPYCEGSWSRRDRRGRSSCGRALKVIHYYMYTYTFMIYVYLFWFQQEAWDFWGSIGREKFGRKELLLDFYIFFVVFELYGVLFHSVSSQVCFVNMWDDAPGDFWRWIVIRWCVVVELKLTNSTWPLIA